jgi:colanic acid/amylovoran biosynthesis glycosyltransferase
MRIVYVTQRLPFGDGETFVVPEIEALLTAGHDVLIIPRQAAGPILHNDARALLPRTRVLPGAASVAGSVAAALARTPHDTAAAFWGVRRTRPRRRALANAQAAAEGMWVGQVARGWGADHIHAHWAHLTATLAMSASMATGIPWSFTAHRYDVILNNLLTEKLRSARFGRFIAREMLAIASRYVPQDALARAVVLHMGVALPPPPEREVSARAVPIVLCPARLVAVKGHHYLLEAAALLVGRGISFELWIAGDGPEMKPIRRQSERLGLENRVRMLGTVPHDELIRLYRERRVDCVVLPSLDLGGGLHEGLSVALVEAMAHGVPVIGTRSGGLPELLADSAGMLVDPADAGALATSLAEVLGSTALRSRLATAGRRRIEEEFDARLIGRQLARWFAGDLRIESAA